MRLDFEGLDEHIVLRVEKAARPSSVRWLCVAHTGLPEWNGTKITFELAEPAPDESELNFRHIGLTPAQECYDHYRVGWDHFLKSFAA